MHASRRDTGQADRIVLIAFDRCVVDGRDLECLLQRATGRKGQRRRRRTVIDARRRIGKRAGETTGGGDLHGFGLAFLNSVARV